MNQNFSEKNIVLLENIVLKIIGYGVGVGKSTISKELAKLLKYKIMDEPVQVI